ncbi:MAG: hypothetical protein EAZ53_02265, partial [Bacteroidetes bacterium]
MAHRTRSRKTAHTDCANGIIRYAYNAIGQMLSQTDAKGNVIRFYYDILGRTTHKVEEKGTNTAGDAATTAIYDYYGNGEAGVNQLKSVRYGLGNGTLNKTVSNPWHAEDYTYDNLGRVTTCLVLKKVYSLLINPDTNLHFNFNPKNRLHLLN